MRNAAAAVTPPPAGAGASDATAPPDASATPQTAPGPQAAASAPNPPDALEGPAPVSQPPRVHTVPQALPPATPPAAGAALPQGELASREDPGASSTRESDGAAPARPETLDLIASPGALVSAGAPGALHATPSGSVHVTPATAPPDRETPPAAPEPDDPVAQIVQAARVHLQSRHTGTIDMQLHPPALGRVRLQVTLHEGAVAAYLGAETPAAHQLLAEQAPALQSALREGGVAVHTLQVGLGLDLGSASHSRQEPPWHAPAAVRPGDPASPIAHRPVPAFRTNPAAGLDYLA